MVGPYGGALQWTGGVLREQTSGEIVEFLARGIGDEPPPFHDAIDVPSAADAVEATAPLPVEAPECSPVAIAVSVSGVHLEYDADLTRQEFLMDAVPSSSLESLASVSALVGDLHARGRIHGDLRFGTVLRLGGRTGVVVPPAGIDAAALLSARLRSGAQATEVAFVAPEVVHGAAATAASDVYSLAALAFAVVGRRAPLALVDARATLQPLGEEVADVLLAALDPHPERRPDASSLARALGHAALRRRALEAGDAVAHPDSSSVLGAVLVVGAVAVFTGILGLALTRWGQLGDLVRLLSCATFTLAMFAVGRWVVRLGSARSGIGLCVLAAQLLWADAWLLLAPLDLERSYAAWAVCGSVIGIIECVAEVRWGFRLMGAFGALAFTISALTLGLLLPIGESHGPSVFAALVALLLWFVSQRVSRWQSVAAPLALTSGLWLAASAAASLLPLAAGQLTALCWPYLLAVGLVALRSLAPAPASRHLDAGVGALLITAPTAQALVLLEHSMTVHVTAVTMLVLVLGAARYGHFSWSMAFAISAAIWTLVSAVVAVAAAEVWRSIGVCLLIGGAALTAHLARKTDARRASRVIAAATLGMLLTVPSAQAMLFRDRIAVVALVLSFGITLVAFAAVKPPAGPLLERAVILVGLAAATLSPGALALGACMGYSAPELGTPVDFASTPRWSYVALTSGGSLLLLGCALRGRALRPEHRRLIELAALSIGPGVFFLLSVPVARSDVTYSGFVLISGGIALTAAVWRRRLLLSMASAGLLLLVLCVQYFAKLTQAVHWGLVALGFGLLILCLAAAYERKLKRLLQGSGAWE